MLLNLLTWAFVAGAGFTALSCLALGLFSLSQYIESHAEPARRLGSRLLWFSTLTALAVTLVDDVPFLPMLPCLLACPLHHRALSQPNWPFNGSSSSLGSLTSLASLLLLPLASHIYLVRHHTLTLHAWHRHRYDTLHRPKLPGGRLDWDVVDSAIPPEHREMTNLQVCAVLAVCVWLVPVWRVLGRVAAAEWGSAGIANAETRKRSKEDKK